MVCAKVLYFCAKVDKPKVILCAGPQCDSRRGAYRVMAPEVDCHNFISQSQSDLKVMKHIESVMDQIDRDLERGQSPRIELLTTSGKKTSCSWPGKQSSEAWRFACLLRILSEIYVAVTDHVVITKRYTTDYVLSLLTRQIETSTTKIQRCSSSKPSLTDISTTSPTRVVCCEVI